MNSPDKESVIKSKTNHKSYHRSRKWRKKAKMEDEGEADSEDTGSKI